MRFLPAVAYHFCLALPAAFTQPGDRLLAEPCGATVNNSPQSGRRDVPVLLPLGDLEWRLLSDVADQEVHEDVLAVVAVVHQPVVGRAQPLRVQVMVIPVI